MTTAHPRIAIVGIGGVFPGAGADLRAFWNIVRDGVDCARDVPPGRWVLDPADAYQPGSPAPDKVYSRRACFLSGFELDPEELDLDPGLLARLDPLFHVALHAGRAAVRDARLESIDRRRMGVIIGNIALPTETSSALTREYLGPVIEARLPEHEGERRTQSTLALNRHVAGLPAGVLARALGLGGGALALDAACASSLYALKLAADELISARADAMLTGGVSRPDSLYTQMGFSQLQALSPSGRCAPFDRRGDGLVVGEGAGMFVLKRLDDAVRDRDPIYAVLAGVGLSNDTRGNLLAPDSDGQLLALRAAYRSAGWNPEDVDLIECHATGTPVGDAVELESLHRLWADRPPSDPGPGRCVIGSVKSNVGHLLTAAGAAGLMKVLLSLKETTLPPTANFERSESDSLDPGKSPFEILREPREWTRRTEETPRRAAISGFGLGGINAHVLLEEWRPRSNLAAPPAPVAPPPAARVAVVGIAARFGPWPDLEAYERRVLGGDRRPARLPVRDWGRTTLAESADRPHASGFLLDGIEIELGRFRIPPKELEETLPQQLMMLAVAADAVANAGQERLRLDDRAGVFIGLGLDPNTNNFHVRWWLTEAARRWNRQLDLGLDDAALEQWILAWRNAAGPSLTANRTMGALAPIVAARIARHFRISGPSFALSSEETSGLRALETGVRALERGEIDTAIVGAVDLAGDGRAPALPEGTVAGEGAAALVLKRLEDARRDGDRIYAVLSGIGTASEGGVDRGVPTTAAHLEAIDRAWANAGRDPGSVGFLEISDDPDLAEAIALKGIGGIETPGRRPPALGRAEAEIGRTGAAAGLAALVRACLCLHHRMLPPLDPPLTHAGTPAVDHPRPWLRNRSDGPRVAAVSGLSVDGNSVHVVLEEDEAADPEPRDVTVPAPIASEGLFAIEGDTVPALLERLDALERAVRARPDRPASSIARTWLAHHPPAPGSRLGLGLVARETGEIEGLLREARALVTDPRPAPVVLKNGGSCVCHAPEPGRNAQTVAFVYPGSGNLYPEMGGRLGAAWPAVLRRQDLENARLLDQYAPDAPGVSARRGPNEALLAQVAFGTLTSDLLERFGIRPAAAIGYSLGESAALFGLRAWTGRDAMLERLLASSLFTSDLGGECRAARRTWRLADGDPPVDWVSGIVGRGARAVRDALGDLERVYLQIINTPSECVVGGDRRGVETLVERLGCAFVPLDHVSTVHCEVARVVADPYRDLHRLEVTPPEGIRFYSGGFARAYALTTERAAEAILAQALDTLDFAAVVERAYADGARIFLEMGPGTSTTRMIGRILGEGRPHVACAIAGTAREEVPGMLRMLARLIAERVPVNLEAVVGREERPRVRDARTLRIALPGEALQMPPLPRAVPAAPAPEVTARDSATAPARTAVPVGDSDRLSALVRRQAATDHAQARAHEAFLRFTRTTEDAMADVLRWQRGLIEHWLARGGSRADAPTFDAPPPASGDPTPPAASPPRPGPEADPDRADVAFERTACLEFAVGSIGRVLGADWAPVDAFPTRVRLPDEPLMLVDRIVRVEGEPRSLGAGRIVTEHDVRANGWYLDAGRIPTSIAIEAGQADLFLSAFLGIDFRTRGLAVYRLLDAAVTFHRELPGPDDVIRYDIRIDRFFRQGETFLFRFRFDGTVNGEPLLTMRDGAAGFFTEAELEAGRGIVAADLERGAGATGSDRDGTRFVEVAGVEAYDAARLAALRQGDLAGCFGPAFNAMQRPARSRPLTIPGGRIGVIDRVVRLEPDGGRYGRGFVRAEQDVAPDAWYLTCHFVDDMVMPGTLMYECSLHTLRVFLLRLGWIGEEDRVAWAPVPGVAARLKCRGQVIRTTRVAAYEVHVKELGFRPEPYAIADTVMIADGKPIVHITDMNVRLTGIDRERLDAVWRTRRRDVEARPCLFNHEQILAFATGKPSEAYGERYRIFDDGRRFIARLPAPPFNFLHRIVRIEGAEAWQLRPGGTAVAEYDVPTDAWYFAAYRQHRMPYAVLLEVALQACGWLAAYLGSALVGEVDLRFRNLGGEARPNESIRPDAGTLTTTVTMTDVSRSGDMIIQRFDFRIENRGRRVFEGNTYFGFFSEAALDGQVGIRDSDPWRPDPAESDHAEAFPFPAEPPFPDARLRMVDRIDCYLPRGGPKGLGFIRGTTRVDPDAWFFKAHFLGDPVWPGSLGLESLLQLLETVAAKRWNLAPDTEFEATLLGKKHRWVYRGQVVPADHEVTVEATVTRIEDESRLILADGYLMIDGRTIYQMNDFGLRAVSRGLAKR